jgi:hypothetical protein
MKFAEFSKELNKCNVYQTVPEMVQITPVLLEGTTLGHLHYALLIDGVYRGLRLRLFFSFAFVQLAARDVVVRTQERAVVQGISQHSTNDANNNTSDDLSVVVFEV